MLTGLVTACVGPAFHNMPLKERQNWWDNKEE